MRILAIDTSLAAASACVLDAGSEPLARETIWLERGHDQTIVPLIDRVVSSVEGGARSIRRVAVTVGPGSFTGIRIGISAARAIGLALGVPVVGVSTLAAYVAPIALDWSEGIVAAGIDARHGRLFVAAFANGKPVFPPRVASPREAVRAMGSGPLRLVGPSAAALAIEAWEMGLAAEVVDSAAAPDIASVARLGLVADPSTAPPRPLYLRAPDVKPAEPAPAFAK